MLLLHLERHLRDVADANADADEVLMADGTADVVVVVVEEGEEGVASYVSLVVPPEILLGHELDLEQTTEPAA